MIYKDFFPTAQAAQAAAVSAIIRLSGKLIADTTAAGEATPTTAPVAKATVLSVTPCPAGSTPGSGSYSIVAWQLTTSDGRSEVVQSIMPTAEIDPSSGGLARFVATGTGSLTAHASIGTTVQVIVAATGTVHVVDGTLFQDPQTNKLYSHSGAVDIGPGTVVLSIDEVDPTDLSEVTYGTKLQFVTAPAGILATATVVQMAMATIPDGSNLVDPATGDTFQTVGDSTLTPGAERISGQLTVACAFLRVVSDNPYTSSASAPAGTVLEFFPRIAGVGKQATVATPLKVTIPGGTDMTCSSIPGGFHVPVDTIVGDAGYVDAAVVPDAGSVGHHLTPSSTLAFASAPAGIAATAVVQSAEGAPIFPRDLPPEVVGGEVEFAMSIRLEQDFRWSATVYTVPLGT